MKTTAIRFGTNLVMQFKAHWLVKRKVKVPISPAESILKSMGIEVVPPKDVLRPAIIEELYEPELESIEETKHEEKPLCYQIKNDFHPLLGMDQCQLITNSVVFDSFPETILERIKSPTKEEQDFVKEAVLHSNILDAQQDKLPKMLDVIKHPGYNPPRVYGIKTARKITSLLYQFALHVCQTEPDGEYKHILEDAVSKVTLSHSGNLFKMKHIAKLMLCSRKPLNPVLEPAEVSSHRDTALPDIFPLSPFVYAYNDTQYECEDGFAVAGGSLAPHTLLVSHSKFPFLLEEEQFAGMSLLHAFSHAAAYAKEIKQDLSGDLEKPVIINVVHTTGQKIHIGRFQLNTLDLTGPTRNLFWHQPWEDLFQTVAFDCAKPSAEEINANPLCVLKALML